MLVVVDRQTGKTAYGRLRPKQTVKGAPSPPETHAEVKPYLDHLLGHNMLAGDGSWAWKQIAKQQGLGQVLYAVHKNKKYVRLHHVEAGPGTVARNVLDALGHPRTKQLRVKGGDNRTEAAIGAVKSALRRRNHCKKGRHACANLLAASFSRHHPGLRSLGLAVRGFMSTQVDHLKPGEQHNFDIFHPSAWHAGSHILVQF